ncbi:MAG: hypothetical protein IT450_02905 [Phycisphaerales bacterium]|nr:hypothetical protein [Phycisphaerales bacterium]
MRFTTLLAILSLTPTLFAADLEVRRVALFSSGVAYFECEATITDSGSAELNFRAAQINDVIKSLIVDDKAGTGAFISYASQAPIERTLKSFGVDITGKPTLAGLLDQLRGEPVEVAGSRAVKGLIVGVEKQAMAVGNDKTIEYDVVNIFTATGIVQLRVSEVESIRLSNPKIENELRKALETLAGGHDADKKTVEVRFDGKGQRKVRVAYLLEAPIWKTTYRLEISADRPPFLQGWATVENPTEEDWRDVRLSLVSGRPISFTMDLYSPIYIKRPHEELELYASLRPQSYEGGIAVMDTKGPPARGARARLEAAKAAAPEAAYERSAGRSVFGGSGAGGNEEEAGDRGWSLADSTLESVASAADAGELFENKIDSPISIARQRSAMLLIINQPVDGTKLSIYNPAAHPKHPLHGLELVNNSKLNLMQGPITVFDSAVYGGDAKLPDMKPGEKRLISYALDLGVEVTTEQKSAPDELVGLRIAKGTLYHRHRYVDNRIYHIKNKDAKDRTVIVEQPYTDDWKLIEPAKPDERATNLSRFRVTAPAGKVTDLPVTIEQTTELAVGLSGIGLDGIQFFIRAKAISPAVKAALENIVKLRTALDEATRAREAAEKDKAEAVAEQARIRENLKTLAQGSDQHKRQSQKFDELETRIEQATDRVKTLRESEDAKRRELEQYMLGLEIE